MPDQLIDQTGERFAICHEWLLYHPKLSSNAKCVYLVLKRHAREKATCFPGQKGICDKLKLTRRTVYDCLQSLQEESLIKIEYSTAGKHKTKSTYTLLMVNGQNLPIQNKVEGAIISHTHGQNLPTKDKQLNENTTVTAIAITPSISKEFTNWWMEAFKTRFGSKYSFRGAIDGKAVKRLIADLPLDELKRRVLNGWNWPDEKNFSTKTVCMTIAGFSTQVNKLMGRLAGPAPNSSSTGQLALQAQWKREQEAEELKRKAQ